MGGNGRHNRQPPRGLGGRHRQPHARGQPRCRRGVGLSGHSADDEGPMRIDTQAHVVSGDHHTYPVNPPDIDPMGTAKSRWFDAPALAVEDLLKRMDDTGIDRAVLVQAFSCYQYDNNYTADAAAAHPDRLTSSCIIDLEHDAAKMVQHWIGERGARAIRLFLRNAAPNWLLQPGSNE